MSNISDITKLLKKYQQPQIGEPESARLYTKQDKRLFERLRYAEYVCSELNITQHCRWVVYYIKTEQNLKDLCRNCPWETIIVGIAFYVKCQFHDCKVTHINRYKICKENKLTLSRYSTIITRLSPDRPILNTINDT